MKSKNSDGAIEKSVRETHPSSYILKIDSFSFLVDLLEKNDSESYQSQIFEASGYKWKLHLYPNRKKERNGEGHISMYLSIENTDAMPPGWEIRAEYKFFVLDQIRDEYLVLQDAVKKERRFREANKEWGFARMLSRYDFEDVDKGFLVEDKCVFGVEIFVHNYCGEGECLAKPEKLPLDSTYSWKVTNYSTLTNAKCTSPLFTLGDYKWTISLYPRGLASGEGKYLSAFLWLDDISAVARVCAEWKLSIKDQKHSNHKVNQSEHVFSPNSDWGWSKFLSLNDIQDDSKGFLVNDTLIIEVEITRISTVKSLSYFPSVQEADTKPFIQRRLRRRIHLL